MEIELIDEVFPYRGSGLPRTPNNGAIHLTDVIDAIEEEMGWGYKGTGFGDPCMSMELGFWWEDVLSAAFRDRHAVRIGEVELDGIIGSPDGLGMWKGELVLEEYKCTWKSTNKTPEDVWRYLVQVKAYCKMLGVTKCIMRIAHVVGKFWGDGPRYRVYLLTFDEVDLEDNWKMIIDQRDEMREK